MRVRDAPRRACERMRRLRQVRDAYSLRRSGVLRYHRAMTYAPRFATVLIGLLCLGSTALHAQTLDPQLTAMRDAIAAAERGQTDAGQLAALSRHPLYGWLEFATLKRSIDTVSNTQAQGFLQRYAGQPVAESFRSIWLPAVARRQDWDTLLANWKSTDNVGLRCAQLTALLATSKADAQWSRDALTLWRNGKALPDACDAVVAGLESRGELTPALRWERVEAAADAQLPAVMRKAARGLPAADLALATDYAAFLDKVHPRALSWPKSVRSRRIAVDGLAKLAKSDPDAAEQQLPQLASALGFSEAQRGQVLYQIALWTVASYLPDSARRLNAVPDASYDERLHEWRAREAMSRGDWPAALAAIRKMPASQRNDSRWQYFEARLAEKTGVAAAAQPLYRAAAQSPTFHGFLAADRLQQPYRLCPWEPNDSPQAKAAVARDPALIRAIALFQIDRPGWAAAEWNDAATRFDDTQRRLAVEVASDNGWFDRAVFALGKQPDEQRLYSLRFPLHHEDTIRREAAKNAIDPAWVAGEIVPKASSIRARAHRPMQWA